jgi:DNA polymerase
VSDATALARALRQRIELGAPAFFFADMDREAAFRLAAAGMQERLESKAPPLPAPLVPASISVSPVSAVAASAADLPASRAAAPEAPSRPIAPETEGMTIEALREAVSVCTLCGLASGRTQAVFADGHPHARVMVVGEAPGANEDRTGLPFVGAAGKLLDLMLAAVDLSRRESVYICNVIKCRPPGNRNPLADEISACAPYLRRQIELVKPEAILAVGTFAGQLLTGRPDTALGTLRGEVHAYEGVPLVVTYHPAALLRNGGWKRPTWDDLQLLRQVLAGT